MSDICFASLAFLMSIFDTREKPLDERLEPSLVGRNLSPGSRANFFYKLV